MPDRPLATPSVIHTGGKATAGTPSPPRGVRSDGRRAAAGRCSMPPISSAIDAGRGGERESEKCETEPILAGDAFLFRISKMTTPNLRREAEKRCENVLRIAK